jgi:hypothetical protein
MPVDPAFADARDTARTLGTYAHEGVGFVFDDWQRRCIEEMERDLAAFRAGVDTAIERPAS